MELWETELMEESARNYQWEEINDVSEEEETEEMNRCRVYDFLCDTLDNFSEGYDRLASAADAAEGFPIECEIMSIANDLDKLKEATDKLLIELKKEMRSV